MKTFKAEIFHCIDLMESKKKHVSISGGQASHSFNFIETITSDTLENLKKKVFEKYGPSYDSSENKLFLAIPEKEWSENECPENYETIFTQCNEIEINMEEN